MKVKVNYEGPEKKYMLPPEKQSCYEYLQECYARISADIGDYTAFVSVDCETKMSKLFEDVEKLAAFLAKEGFKKGDVYTILLPTSAHAFTSFYSLNKLGIIANIVHPLTPPESLKDILELTKSKGIFILDRAAAAYADILKNTHTIVCSTNDYTYGPVKAYVAAQDAELSNVPEGKNIHRFADILKGEYVSVPTVTDPYKETMIYLHGGGTTGKSKTIQHSCYSLNYLAYSFFLLDKDHDYGNAYNLCVLPCFHAYGLGGAMHYALCNAYSAIVMPKFDAYEANEKIRKYNVQEILGVPNMFKKMYEADNFINEGLKNLNFVSCGGDIVSEHFIEEFTKALHDNGSTATLCRGWGLTEMCAIGTTNSWIYTKSNSVGVPVESVEVQIVDEDGNELDYGVLGEITLRGEMMMNGYLPDGYVKDDGIWTDKDGVKWIRTGDMGMLDEDGYLYFLGRKKRIIIISGYNVYPHTIEQKLARLDYLLETCAVQGYDENGKPCVKLCIVLKNPEENHDEIKEKVLDFCKENLDHFSVPRKIEILDALPRTKVDKINFLAISDTAPEGAPANV